MKSRLALAIFLLLAFVPASVPAQDDTGDSAVGGATRKADSPALRPIQDTPGLPRVLLIGDSISIGYTTLVRQALKRIANVHRPLTNCGDTKKGLQELDGWLGKESWDVIHFNWGLHDIKYLAGGQQNVPPAEYEKNLRALVAKLKATGAVLIWASTTPVPVDDKSSPHRAPEDVAAYNRIAAKVMEENGIKTDDMYALVLPQEAQIQIPANVHYKLAGWKLLAGQVSASIEDALKSGKHAAPGETSSASKSPQ